MDWVHRFFRSDDGLRLHRGDRIVRRHIHDVGPRRLDQDVALRRMEAAGAILTTVEATAFEWLGGADHPHFKSVSKMIQERMAALRTA